MKERIDRWLWKGYHMWVIFFLLVLFGPGKTNAQGPVPCAPEEPCVLKPWVPERKAKTPEQLNEELFERQRQRRIEERLRELEQEQEIREVTEG